MYRNALEDDFRIRLAKLRTIVHFHDRGVLLGVVFSVVPIPPVALVGLIIGLFNLRLLARRMLPESERQLVRFSLMAALISFVTGTALFAAIGWVVVHTLSVKLPAVLGWLQDLVTRSWHRPLRLAPARGMQDI